MRLPRAVWPAFGASCVLAFFGSACGSSSGSNVNGGDGTGNGADGTGAGNGTGTGTGASKATGGGPNLGNNLGGMSSSSAGTSNVDNECAGTLIQAERIPLDMYIMLDVSGSMTEPTAGDPGVTKWESVSSALTDFVSDPASDGIGMGLQVFPIIDPKAPTSCMLDADCANYGPCMADGCWPPRNGIVDPCFDDDNCALGQYCTAVGTCSKDATLGCDRELTATCTDKRGRDFGDCVVEPSFCLSVNDCKPATYAAPAAAIAPLPSASDAIIKVIQASTPPDWAFTPTGPALAGAIQQAKTWATAHTDHQVVAVLATDGLPTLKTQGNVCAPVNAVADINAIVKLASTGHAGTPSISTFVIGVFSPDDIGLGAPMTLDAIATAGGTGQSFVVNTQNDVQLQFRDALNKIRATGLSCELAVPTAEAGKTVDYSEVNVAFDSGAGPVDLESVPSEADCAAHPQAWYYNVDPAQGTPTRIEACPGICSDFEKTDMGSVQIKLGCKTRVVVK